MPALDRRGVLPSGFIDLPLTLVLRDVALPAGQGQAFALDTRTEHNVEM